MKAVQRRTLQAIAVLMSGAAVMTTLPLQAQTRGGPSADAVSPVVVNGSRAVLGVSRSAACEKSVLSDSMMREAVELINGRAVTEASGGVTLERVRSIAETGVGRPRRHQAEDQRGSDLEARPFP